MTTLTITEQLAELPSLTPPMSFDEASERVLDYLRRLLPLSFWSVTAYDAEGER